jgi:hypothetical protein
VRDLHDEKDHEQRRTGRDSGYKDATPFDGSPDYEGGYGGGRERAERSPEHAFGEKSWSEGRGGRAARNPQESEQLPKGATDGGPGDPKWQERFVDENADKFGQAGGEPTKQRGPAQSAGGKEHVDAPPESVAEGGPRGGYGTSEPVGMRARDPRKRD